MIRKTQIVSANFCWENDHLRSVGFTGMLQATRSSEWTLLRIWSRHFNENVWFPLTCKSSCWKFNSDLSNIWSSMSINR
jgi:hypothetical protein